MAKNQRNITLASFKYLYDVQAIPKQVRSQYLQNLLKRKGTSHQKSVKVLKVIYRYVDENIISRWNPQLICKELGIKMNMLYCHKSRLLKGLRELYFNWKLEEKKIEDTYELSKIRTSDMDYKEREENTRQITIMFAKARRMAELGMMREAKRLYLKLLKNAMNTQFLEQNEKNILKSEIYEYLVFYYYNRRNKKGLKHYNEMLKALYDSSKTLNPWVYPAQEALFTIRQRYSDFYLQLLKWYENGCKKIENNNIEEIYDLSKKSNNLHYLLKSIHHKVILKITGGDLKTAKEICIEGYNTALEHGKVTELHTFASILYFLKTKTTVTNIKLRSEKILDHYRRVKESAPLNFWTIYLENSISMIFYPDIMSKAPEILSEQANTNILIGDYSHAVYWKFIHAMELYHKDLLGFFSYNTEGYLEMNAASPQNTENVENICFNTLCCQKAIIDLKFLWSVYNTQLTVSFFRENDFDPGYPKHIISKIGRIKKKGDHDTRFELLVLALSMLENRENPKYIANKFEHRFKKLIDSNKASGSEFNIIDYAIISSLARRLKSKEIWTIAKDFYNWLENNRPEMLSPANRAIEERNAKVYLVDGSKGAA